MSLQQILAPLAPLESLLAEETSVKRAMCITTTVKRGETLKADGYEFVRTDRNGVYEVRKPAKVNKKTGEITEFEPYIVDVQAQTCTCIQFERCGVCKHERAVRSAVREALHLLIGGQS